MKVLVLTKQGEMLSMALHIQEEGHKVLLHTWREDGPLNPGQALLLTKQFLPDLTLVDAGLGKVADFLRGQGMKVWGSSRWGDVLSSSEDYSTRVMMRVGWTTVDPTEVLGGWWNGSSFSFLFQATLTLGFMDGGHGPQTLEAITIHSTRAPALLVFSDILKKTSYIGPFFAGERLSVTPHAGLHAAISELLPQGQVESILQEQLKLRKQTSLALHLSLPPYPYYSGKPLPLKPEDSKHTWLKSRAGEVRDDVGWVSARGEDLRECQRRVYRTVGKINQQLPELQFRLDLRSGISEVRRTVEVKVVSPSTQSTSPSPLVSPSPSPP